MAVIYAGTTDSGIIVKYNNGYSNNIATTTAATGELDLSRYLYSSANEATFARIKDSVNQYVTAGVASGIYTSAYNGTATTATATSSFKWDPPTTGSWVTDYDYDTDTNGLTLRVNAALTEEEFKRHEKVQKMRSNLSIQVKLRGSAPRLSPLLPKNEQNAIETLRESITETEFRKYLKYGFVLIEGKDGRTYQVFRNRSHTKVWKGGHVIEEICVYIKNSNIPPTDSVIAFRTMIQASEEDFRKMGNVYPMVKAA